MNGTIFPLHDVRRLDSPLPFWEEDAHTFYVHGFLSLSQLWTHVGFVTSCRLSRKSSCKHYLHATWGVVSTQSGM